MDNQDLLLTKKLLLTYKEKLENEIINRSSKLKIPKNSYENTITKNEEIIKLKKALEEIEKNSIELKKIEE